MKSKPFSPFQKILLLSGISLILTLFNFLYLKNPFFGGFSFIFSLILASFLIGNTFFQNLKTLQKMAFSILFSLFLIIILASTVYYLKSITPLASFLIGFFPLLFGIVLFLLPKKPHIEFPKIEFKTPSFLSIFIGSIDIFLLFYLFVHQTKELSPSPWQNVTPLFFCFFTISSALLFFHAKIKQNKTETLLLTALHVFIVFSITSILYPLGYGFDAFIHRATEEWIFEHGFIFPKTPYYIGQYSLVTLLAHITSIPIKYIDIFLLPILASITLPPILIHVIEKTVEPKQKEIASILFWLIPFLPFLFFHLTTPHNLVIFFLLISLFSFFLSFFEKVSPLFLLLLAIAGIFTHALIGVPLFIITCFFILLPKAKNKKILFFTAAISLIIVFPAMFLINSIRTGAHLPELQSPISKIPEFLSLFKRPYWYAKTSSIPLELLYAFERILPFILFILSIIGTFFISRKKLHSHIHFFFSFSIVFFLASFTLFSTIVFQNVISYEQKDYPLRLVFAGMLFLLPAALIGTNELRKKIPPFSLKTVILCTTLATIATAGLYLSYPQRNQKSRFPGYNVTSSDFKAVDWIQNRQNDKNYIVLSNQLLSAAALERYSFARYFKTPEGELFYYSIPTGGILYGYYGKMIYEGQKREYMEEAMNTAGVDTAYFVIHEYWGNSKTIIENTKKIADTSHSIDDGKIWIFIFSKNHLFSS